MTADEARKFSVELREIDRRLAEIKAELFYGYETYRPELADIWIATAEVALHATRDGITTAASCLTSVAKRIDGLPAKEAA